MATLDESTSTAKARAGDVAEKAKNRASEVADRAQEEASKLAHDAESQAKDLAGTAEQKARGALEKQKGQTTAELDNIAQAFRQTGRQLRNQDQDTIASYSNQIADQVEQVSSYLQNRTLDDLLMDAEDFARRQPEIFLGGAFAVGLLAARFFKSSSTRRRRSPEERYYGQRGYRSTAYEGEDHPLAEAPRPLPRTGGEARPYATSEGVENFE